MFDNSFAAVVAAALCGVFAVAQVKADNVVVNPGFETANVAGWILSGTDASPGDNGIYYGVDARDAHSGRYGAYFGPVGGVLSLSQALSTTPGTSYAVSFWLAQAPATPFPYLNSLAVVFGETTIFSETAVPASGYKENSYTGFASSSSTILLFALRDDTGFFSLDDIAVVSDAVPEPASLLLVAPVLGALFLSRAVGRGRRPTRAGNARPRA
jgi:hypothetical protein